MRHRPPHCAAAPPSPVVPADAQDTFHGTITDARKNTCPPRFSRDERAVGAGETDHVPRASDHGSEGTKHPWYTSTSSLADEPQRLLGPRGEHVLSAQRDHYQPAARGELGLCSRADNRTSSSLHTTVACSTSHRRRQKSLQTTSRPPSPSCLQPTGPLTPVCSLSCAPRRTFTTSVCALAASTRCWLRHSRTALSRSPPARI